MRAPVLGRCWRRGAACCWGHLEVAQFAPPQSLGRWGAGSPNTLVCCWPDGDWGTGPLGGAGICLLEGSHHYPRMPMGRPSKLHLPSVGAAHPWLTLWERSAVWAGTHSPAWTAGGERSQDSPQQGCWGRDGSGQAPSKPGSPSLDPVVAGQPEQKRVTQPLPSYLCCPLGPGTVALLSGGWVECGWPLIASFKEGRAARQ